MRIFFFFLFILVLPIALSKIIFLDNQSRKLRKWIILIKHCGLAESYCKTKPYLKVTTEKKLNGYLRYITIYYNHHHFRKVKYISLIYPFH